ncbi:hypothetical protein DFH08DRAFT_986571 [Mycena albidolilacea]|uniref:Uncharacterized protein n=1 Tax=Mycena albidolilacea TaxID=1033008 RepID=A0AAD6Z163_9AGAR|nr:hypothetical protein DFH08DRAFT_986571 [Mycena albidolilacea]
MSSTEVVGREAAHSAISVPTALAGHYSMSLRRGQWSNCRFSHIARSACGSPRPSDQQSPQTIELSEEAENDDRDDRVDVYECDVPLAVISDHLLSGGSLAPNFAVSAEGGITRCGDTKASDTEQAELEAEPAVLGRGQHRKIAARCYQGPAWEVFWPYWQFFYVNLE